VTKYNLDISENSDKYLESLEIGAAEVLHRIKEEINILHK
jgi:hypothetical protein